MIINLLEFKFTSFFNSASLFRLSLPKRPKRKRRGKTCDNNISPDARVVLNKDEEDRVEKPPYFDNVCWGNLGD